MRRIALLAIIAGFFVPLVVSAPAHAQAVRTWVSGVGDDVNPCSRTAPCKTFAGAISKTAAGGEINCLDPGGFGTLTITKAITISCEIGTAGVLASGTNGFNINAGANDTVYLKGLDIEGNNVAGGSTGIQFNSGLALTVENCMIKDFTGFGINHAPTTIATLTVINSKISHNGTSNTTGGIQVAANGGGFGRALLSRVTVDRNSMGVMATGTGPTSAIQVYESTVSGSMNTGVSASGTGAVVTVGGSAIVGNGGAATSGNVLSYGNNEIKDNSTDTVPASAGGLH
jgi:hypothetical protein